MPIDRALEEANARTQLLDAVEANLLRFPLPHPQPVSSEVVSAAASALPSRIIPAAPPRSRSVRGSVCPACGKALPPTEDTCRACAGRPLARAALELPPVEVEPWAELPASGRQPRLRLFSWQLLVVVAVAFSVGVVSGAAGLGVVVWQFGR